MALAMTVVSVWTRRPITFAHLRHGGVGELRDGRTFDFTTVASAPEASHAPLQVWIGGTNWGCRFPCSRCAGDTRQRAKSRSTRPRNT